MAAWGAGHTLLIYWGWISSSLGLAARLVATVLVDGGPTEECSTRSGPHVFTNPRPLMGVLWQAPACAVDQVELSRAPLR